MRYRLAPEAREEYRAAAFYYLQESPRIAMAFVDEVEAGIAQIRARPATWRILEDGIRRYLVKRFPYGIYYTVEQREVVVWAIMHLHRRSDYWKTRQGP